MKLTADSFDYCPDDVPTRPADPLDGEGREPFRYTHKPITREHFDACLKAAWETSKAVIE